MISFDDNIEVFSEEMKKNFMIGYLLITWIEGNFKGNLHLVPVSEIETSL